MTRPHPDDVAACKAEAKPRLLLIIEAIQSLNYALTAPSLSNLTTKRTEKRDAARS